MVLLHQDYLQEQLIYYSTIHYSMVTLNFWDILPHHLHRSVHLLIFWLQQSIQMSGQAF